MTMTQNTSAVKPLTLGIVGVGLIGVLAVLYLAVKLGGASLLAC